MISSLSTRCIWIVLAVEAMCDEAFNLYGIQATTHLCSPLVVMGPEHAATVANDGISKKEAKKFIAEHAKIPLGAFSMENINRRFRVAFASVYKHAGMDALVPMIHNPDNLLIAVIGGAGKHSAVIPTFGASQAVTKALKRKDGRYARKLQEMRRA